MKTVNDWFELTYAAYVVLPRISMQKMSDEWQEGFIDLMEEASKSGLFPDCPNYTVLTRDDKGKFYKDPFSDYRHGDLKEMLRNGKNYSK